MVCQSDSPDTAAVTSRNAVTASQPFIQERLVSTEQLHDAAILKCRAAHEQLSLALNTLQQTFIVIRILFGIHNDFRNASQIQPLSGEIVHERIKRAWVG